MQQQRGQARAGRAPGRSAPGLSPGHGSAHHARRRAHRRAPPLGCLLTVFPPSSLPFFPAGCLWMTCTTTCTRAPHRHALCMLVLPLLSCVVCPAESALGGSGGPAVSRPCPAAARAGAQEERKQENKATAPALADSRPPRPPRCRSWRRRLASALRSTAPSRPPASHATGASSSELRAGRPRRAMTCKKEAGGLATGRRRRGGWPGRGGGSARHCGTAAARHMHRVPPLSRPMRGGPGSSGSRQLHIAWRSGWIAPAAQSFGSKVGGQHRARRRLLRWARCGAWRPQECCWRPPAIPVIAARPLHYSIIGLARTGCRTGHRRLLSHRPRRPLHASAPPGKTGRRDEATAACAGHRHQPAPAAPDRPLLCVHAA